MRDDTEKSEVTTWTCAKCGANVGTDRSICRACGGARTFAATGRPPEAAPSSVPDAATVAAAVVDEPDAPEAGTTNAAPWTCAKCRTTIEPEFEICWRCGTSNVGVEDSDFQRVADVASPMPGRFPFQADGREAEAVSGPPGVPPDRTCPACGEMLVPIQLIDTSGRFGMDQEELRYAASGARTGGLFGDPIEGIIRAQLCPRCGRVGLYAVPTP